MTDETGPFEKYDQLVSPDEELRMEVTRVGADGWPIELNGVPVPAHRLANVLLDNGWCIHRQTGHDGYEEVHP